MYSDLCPGDPLCVGDFKFSCFIRYFSGFGFTADRKPTKSMRESMLYKMHSNGKAPVTFFFQFVHIDRLLFTITNIFLLFVKLPRV